LGNACSGDAFSSRDRSLVGDLASVELATPLDGLPERLDNTGRADELGAPRRACLAGRQDGVDDLAGGHAARQSGDSTVVEGRVTGNVVIDEAAWIPDVENLWLAIVPTISTRSEYRLSVVSTPGPRAGMFHRLWNNGDPTWSRHCVSIQDAQAGGAPHDLEALRAAVADEATWRAAYECQFVDEAHALLPYDLLLARVDDTLPYHLSAQAFRRPGDFYAGYDVGRKHDMSVLIVVERIKKDIYWRGAVELRQGHRQEAYRGLHREGLRRRRLLLAGHRSVVDAPSGD